MKSKKEKSQVVGFRLPSELYDKVNELSQSFQYSLVDIIKKSLSFFIDNPEKVITFRKFVPNSYVNGFYADPVFSLKKIRENGVDSREELLWIAELLETVWYRYSDYKTSSGKVEKVIMIIKTLIYEYDLNKIERIDYIASKFPERKDKDIKVNIDEALKSVNSKSRISAGYAESVSRCLIEIIKDESVKISQKNFIEINKIIDEEIIWVATKGLILNNGDKINTTPLIINRRIKYEDRQTISSGSIDSDLISISYMLSEKNYIKEELFKNSFSYVIYITNTSRNRRTASFTGIAKTLFDLKFAIDSLNDVNCFGRKNVIGNYEEWELCMNPELKLNYIQYGLTVRIYLEEKEMIEFINKVTEFYNNKDVKNDVLSEYVDLFGMI
jgi:hypothetical protein